MQQGSSGPLPPGAAEDLRATICTFASKDAALSVVIVDL